ncbi:DUF3253 domain-containing protein [Nesterenkonia natronophila]|uniref:DUF3253 domain-containing protein n=1 Tax=Nesterenkonia natronophila TaxID=2174932 RepID=A0A3A4F2J8_9MICC|nr:DUF3253 domain-containing protein [Nesterenkonia natronophila]RJN32522.1 DUF3253 domain-containing protein [Nesterenkonia natronophila]
MTDQEKSDDGRYIVIKGQKWRASDPAIPDRLRAELVKELMAARRLVKTRGDDVRFRVHDAKVALGERGQPWWEPTDTGRRERAAATIRSLLRHRDGSTICPSDAARVVGGQAWRSIMPLVREVASEMCQKGQIRITQKGESVGIDVRGPVRLGAGEQLKS